MRWPTKKSFQKEIGTVMTRHKELEDEVLTTEPMRFGATVGAEQGLQHTIALFDDDEGKIGEGDKAVIDIGEHGQVFVNLDIDDLREIRNGLTEKELERQTIQKHMRLKNHHDELDFGPQEIHCPICAESVPFRAHKMMSCEDCGKRFKVDMNPTD